MKNSLLQIILYFMFSIPFCLANVKHTHSEFDFKGIEIEIAEKIRKEKTFNDSLSQAKAPKSFFKRRKEKTKVHKLGLFSYLTLWSSYGLLLMAAFASSSSFDFLVMTLLVSGLGIGLMGFLIALASLVFYSKEKNKKGRAFPIMSILMVLFPIGSILWILIQLSKNTKD